jgi:hypothetical protein
MWRRWNDVEMEIVIDTVYIIPRKTQHAASKANRDTDRFLSPSTNTVGISFVLWSAQVMLNHKNLLLDDLEGFSTLLHRCSPTR